MDSVTQSTIGPRHIPSWVRMKLQRPTSVHGIIVGNSPTHTQSDQDIIIGIDLFARNPVWPNRTCQAKLSTGKKHDWHPSVTMELGSAARTQHLLADDKWNRSGFRIRG